MDMFVTALELAGGSLPTDRTYDGRSLVPVLKSPTPEAAKTPHDFYLYYCSSRLMAVRHGNPHEHSWDLRSISDVGQDDLRLN